jgi:hypothetical protein
VVLVATKKETVEDEPKIALPKCAICGSPCTPASYPQPAEDEQLCWVCRRLKISAWRDSDVQPQSAQE